MASSYWPSSRPSDPTGAHSGTTPVLGHFYVGNHFEADARQYVGLGAVRVVQALHWNDPPIGNVLCGAFRIHCLGKVGPERGVDAVLLKGGLFLERYGCKFLANLAVNSPDFLQSAIPRSAFSAALFVRQMPPSSRKRARPSQRGLHRMLTWFGPAADVKCQPPSGLAMRYPTPRTLNIQAGFRTSSPSSARSVLTKLRTMSTFPASRPFQTLRRKAS